jgi:hypothetical protein
MRLLPCNTLRYAIRRLSFPLRLQSYSPLSSSHVPHRRKLTSSFSSQVSRPRVFPSSAFTILDPSVKIEEENLPDYLKERYYPVQIGEGFSTRYQVITKLGFGSSSTVWLCRDLQ